MTCAPELAPYPGGDYRSTEDNAIPPAASDEAWEAPATLNQTWGYRTDDHNWKSSGEVGAWLRVNGEAVYGTTRSPFGEEFGDYATNLKNREGKPVFNAHTNWRCTARPGKLYFTLFHVERDGPLGFFALPDFKNAIKRVYQLDDPAQTPFEVKTLPDGRRYFNASRHANDSMGTIYVVEIEGEAVQR